MPGPGRLVARAKAAPGIFSIWRWKERVLEDLLKAGLRTWKTVAMEGTGRMLQTWLRSLAEEAWRTAKSEP